VSRERGRELRLEWRHCGDVRYCIRCIYVKEFGIIGGIASVRLHYIVHTHLVAKDYPSLSLTPDIEAGEGGHYSCALEARRPCPLHNSVFFRDPNFFPLPRLILARFHQGSTQYTRRWSLNVKQTKDQSSSPSRAIRAMAFSVQRSLVPSNTRTLNTIAVSSSSKQKKHYGSRTTVGYMRP
jgi:hypothetical protein